MSSIVVVGTQWGDEGKGKITDFLAEQADVIARFSGGNNAGHTIKFGGETYKLHLVPSGIFYKEKLAVIGNGVVVDPVALLKELDALNERGISTDNLRISNRAQVILPYHIKQDEYEEERRGDNKIGTTKKGIGPAYVDKAQRIGIRVADLLDKETFEKLLKENIEFFNLCFEAFANIDASFVVSIGHDNQLEDFNTIPSNFTVAHVVPQTELLQHTSLFLTHAGMNSTNEAMLMEVPMLAFPQSADQPVVARQIEKLLVGRQLQLENITSRELKQIVLDMLDDIPNYQRNIRKVKSIQSSNKTGYQLAVDHILNFRDQYVTHSNI